MKAKAKYKGEWCIKLILFSCFIFSCYCANGKVRSHSTIEEQSEYQWAAEMPEFVSEETGGHPTAFLWIPPKCRQIRGILFGQHNMLEEGMFMHEKFRKNLEKLGIAEIWLSPGVSQDWAPNDKAQTAFINMLQKLAEISGYTELEYAPIIPIGHSAMATFPWNFAAFNKDRTLAILSIHGDAPSTDKTGYGRKNIDWDNLQIDGVPGLMVMGEFEWWEARIKPALTFRQQHPKSCISFLCDAGHGHFDYSDELMDYLSLFLKKTMEKRFPKQWDGKSVPRLMDVNPKEGWLAERWHVGDNTGKAHSFEGAPYDKYSGDRNDAFWYFDKEMVRATLDRYATSIGKQKQYLGFEQYGSLLRFDPKSHMRINATFKPKSDGVTFHIKGVFTDTLRSRYSDEHAQVPIQLSRICGPILKVDDSTFCVRFYRMGMYNKKRTSDICLLARCAYDKAYKSDVQQICIHMPYRITNGAEQHINFKKIGNIERTTKDVTLNASSSSGLPVYFYVKYGPAKVLQATETKDQKAHLIISKIPVKTRFPIRVSVVAWQYGIDGSWQTAEPIEKEFMIYKSNQ